jgi:hypothetical protein
MTPLSQYAICRLSEERAGDRACGDSGTVMMPVSFRGRILSPIEV